jgi:hypothetical protein
MNDHGALITSAEWALIFVCGLLWTGMLVWRLCQ